jgi:AcrR family transcriptional regulator
MRQASNKRTVGMLRVVVTETSSRRRTQRERTRTTTSALVLAARELFARDGYAATSLDAVVTAAGLTKGAVYHHFSGKQELFRAVYEHEQAKLVEEIARAWSSKRDPWEAFEAGCRAFFEYSADPGAQRITILDAPGALGWDLMRELESTALNLTKIGLQQAMDAGRIDRRPVGPLAHLLFGAMCEGAVLIAGADDQPAAQRQVLAEFRRLLRSMATA